VRLRSYNRSRNCRTISDAESSIWVHIQKVGDGNRRYAKLLRALSRVKLLILDDWGPEAKHCEFFMVSLV
jgi:hypothetical protein